MYQGAIIGLGNVALGGHLPGWQRRSEFRIVAGVDSELKRWKLLKEAFPAAATYSSIADLPPDLQFVDICTPPHTHFEIAASALKRGWNVLCEKPLVLTEEQFHELRRLATERNLVLFTVHNWKFAPICRQITDLIRSGVLGEIRHCAWQVMRDGPSVTTGTDNWRLDPQRSGGGILVDHGWHAFYLLLEWLARSPTAVRASLENRRQPRLDVEDTAIVSLQFDGAKGRAPTAHVFLTWASPTRRNLGIIEGSLARLSIEDSSLCLDGGAGGRKDFFFDSALSNGSHHPDWFEFVAEEFLHELKDDSRRGTNLSAAHLCLRLIDRCRASDRAREFVPL